MQLRALSLRGVSSARRRGNLKIQRTEPEIATVVLKQNSLAMTNFLEFNNSKY